MNREAPFGYEWKDGELVVNEKNASIVWWVDGDKIQIAKRNEKQE